MTSSSPHPQPVVLGVAGTPDVVANSLSPRMMAAAFAELGLDAHYVPLAIRERSVAKALRALPRLGFRGCNVTMPFKPVAAEVAHTRSELVERTGIANTLVVAEDGTIHAEATDGLAVTGAIRDRGVELAGATVVLLGAGGAALDAAVACADAGAERLEVWNRTRANAERLADRLRSVAPALGVQVHDRMPIRGPAHVLLGCVPADSLDQRALAGLHEDTLVVDLAYRRDGRPTPLMVAVAGRPERGVDGRELLVRQGAESFRAWFGIEAPTGVMTSAVR
ncbi:MAG: aroE [Thermoleophilia bacterium]|nr:aroE [Thermoleophilia bacterium]